ncbi:hypothetical protein SH661x_004473 [Planctomicrobium sp. SH661]|uniref:hypothetical protein n=1 Tax=Planctomicrobium sp. SH661 TaxID=3448124 RepID=UPI003F5C93D3
MWADFSLDAALFRFVRQYEVLAAVVFRLVLMTSLWQGPVVWGHSHHQTEAELADHIARFHSGVSDCRCNGWHWHCSLPDDVAPKSSGQSNGNGKCPSSPRDLVRVVTFDSASSFSVVGYLSFDRFPSHAAMHPLLKTSQGGSTQLLFPFEHAHASQYVLCRIVC